MPDTVKNPLMSIYEGLSSKNPQLKEAGFDAFQSDMKNPESLQSVFNGLSAKNPQLKNMGFESFKSDMFPDVQDTVDYGPFDKDTVEKSPEARQNFERWQKDGTSPKISSLDSMFSEIETRKNELGKNIEELGKAGDVNLMIGLSNLNPFNPVKVPMVDAEGDGEITPTSKKTAPLWDEYKKLEQAQDLITKAKEYQSAPSKNSLMAFWKGLKSPLAKDLLSGGITEMERNLQLAESSTTKEGTGADQKLIEAYKALKEIQQNPELEPSFLYQTGETVSNVIPYILQFALTRGSGTAVKASVNELLKTSAKTGIGNIAKKAGAYTAGAMGQAVTMPMMYSKYGEETLEGKPVGEALLQSFLKTTGETFGENFGEVGQKLLTKAISSNSKPIRSAFQKAIGWNGPWEYVEENVTNAWNTALTDEREWKDFWNWKEQGLIALTTSIVGAPMYLQDKVAQKNVTNKYRKSEDKINNLDENISRQVFEAVNDESPDQTLSNLYNVVVNNEITDPETRKDIFAYAQNRFKYNSMFNQEGEKKEIQSDQPQIPQPTPQQTREAQFAESRNKAAEMVQFNYDRLKHTDGNLHTGYDSQGNEYIVLSETPGGMAIVHDATGEKKTIPVSDIKDRKVQTFDEFTAEQMGIFDQENSAMLQPKEQSTFKMNGKLYSIQDVTTDGKWIASELDAEGSPSGQVIEVEKEYQDKMLSQLQNNPEKSPELNVIEVGGKMYSFTPANDGTMVGEVYASMQEAEKAKADIETVLGAKDDITILSKPNPDPMQPDQFTIAVKPKTDLSQTEGENLQFESLLSDVDKGLSPEMESELQKETEPSYSFKGQPIDKKKAMSIINIAADLKNKDKLAGLQYANDPELDELVEKHFPKPVASFKIGNKKYDEESATTYIEMADNQEELDRLKIENIEAAPEVQKAYDAKMAEFGKAEKAVSEQKNTEHNKLVRLVQDYNTKSDYQRKQTNTSPIVTIASQLGYNTKTDAQGKLIVADKGTEIRMRGGRINTNEEIQSHKSVQDYSPEVQETINRFMLPFEVEGVEIGTLAPKEVKQAILDIQAGKKTVASNSFLDEIEKIHNVGTIRLKGDRRTGMPGVDVPINEYLEAISEETTSEDEDLGILIPEDVAGSVIADRLSPEILDQFEKLIFETNGKEKTNAGTDASISEVEKQMETKAVDEEISESTKNVNNISEKGKKFTETETQDIDTELEKIFTKEESLQNNQLEIEKPEKSLPKTEQDDSRNIAGVPSPERGRETIKQARPDKTGSGRKVGTSGDVQVNGRIQQTEQGKVREQETGVEDTGKTEYIEPGLTTEQPAAISKTVAPVVETIRQLGTGANVYYETNKYRVNDLSNGKVILNINDNENGQFPIDNIEFDNINEAVKIAELLNKVYPDGVPSALLIDKVVSDWRQGKNIPVVEKIEQEAKPVIEERVPEAGKMIETPIISESDNKEPKLVGKILNAYEKGKKRGWGVIRGIEGDNYLIHHSTNPEGYKDRKEPISSVNKWFDEGLLFERESKPKIDDKFNKSEVTLTLGKSLSDKNKQELPRDVTGNELGNESETSTPTNVLPEIGDDVSFTYLDGSDVIGQIMSKEGNVFRIKGQDGTVYRVKEGDVRMTEGEIRKRITPNQAKSLPYKVELPNTQIFTQAVENTPDAKITDEGLVISVVRFQKPEQEGELSVRTGVFYLPSSDPNVKYYKGKFSYGGKQKQEGETLIKKPIFVKGATGGKAPENAYDQIKGKVSYQNMRSDVLSKVVGWNKRVLPEDVAQLLTDYNEDTDYDENYDMAYEIVRVSREGNLLPYNIQENIVAHAIRNAGYDAVIGYSTKRDGTPFISEIFDVREITYPSSDVESDIHESFLEENNIRFRKLTPAGYYSTVENALEKIQQEKGTPEQFKAMLLKNGAKQVELDWMLNKQEFPEGKTITKSDIQEWIDENRIEVEEVEKGGFNDGDIAAWWNDEGGANEEVDFYDLSESEKRGARERYSDEVGDWGGTDTKFSQYVLPGGENYKEVLLTMPEKQVDNPQGLHVIKDGYGYAVIDENNNTIDRNYAGEKDANEAILNGSALKIFNKKRDKSFRSSHFDEPNILAHIRLNERTDSKGNKVLFIEEWQADKGQEWQKLKKLIDSGKATQADIDRFNFLDKNFPFNKTSEWLPLAMRRIIRYAAENGFDRIAWTTGEQQAERYDLSKQLSAIHIEERSGKYLVDVWDESRNKYIDRRLVKDQNELSELIGKDMTNKFLTEREKGYKSDNFISEDPAGNAKMSFEGLDLKVGGEGMKAFYDAIVPSAASKLGKPFNSKVESVEIPQVGSVQSIPVTPEMIQSVSAGVPLFKPKSALLVRQDSKQKIVDKLNEIQSSAKNARPMYLFSNQAELESAAEKAGAGKNTKASILKSSKDAMAFYDPITKAVYINTSKINNLEEAVAVWLHEMGIHAGLENIIPEAEFNGLMEAVFDFVKKEAETNPYYKALFDEVTGQYSESNKAIQGEEMLAWIAERAGEGTLAPENKALWKRLVDYIKDLLKRIYGVKNIILTEKDVMNIVNASIRSNFEGEIQNKLPEGIKKVGSFKTEEATTRLDNLKVAREMEESGQQKTISGELITNISNTGSEFSTWRRLLDEIKSSENNNYSLKYDENGNYTDNEEEFDDYEYEGTTDRKFAVQKNDKAYKEFDSKVKELAKLLDAEYSNPYSDSWYIVSKDGSKTISFRDHEVKQSTLQHHKEIYSIDYSNGVSKSETENAIKWFNEGKSFTPQQIKLATGWERGVENSLFSGRTSQQALDYLESIGIIKKVPC